MPEVGPEHSETSPQNQAENIAWFYGRYSDTELQNKDSIDQQLLASRTDAAKQGQVIPQERVFADAGIRGSEDDRPELNRLQNLIRSGVKCIDLYIFDTSRLARDREIAARLQKFFDFHRVRVHYVANGMISGNASFNLQHAIYSAFDQQFSRTLGENVKRGHRHRFETGYFAGARCYGHRHVPDIDPACADSYNRRRRRGVWVELDPVESEVVRVAFRLYRGGKGYTSIARYLNEQGIRSPRRPTRNSIRCWSASSVRTILSNERYIGIVRLGVLETLKDPDTKKVVHRKRPEAEWKTYHAEGLRIVSDEEFYAVAKLRASRDTRKTGGLNKAKGVYIWSGLLKCGVCEGSITICQPGIYMCSTAYKKGGCTNRMKLSRLALERDLTELLVRMVREARSFDAMVEAVAQEVNRQQEEAEKAAKAASANRETVEVKLSSFNKEISGLVASLIQHGFSEAISTALREREAHKKLLLQQIEKAENKEVTYFTREQVAEFLSSGLSEMAEILLADTKTCREEIHKRVSHLMLTPVTLENHPAYEISGDLRLFNEEKAKILGCNGSITVKHFGLNLNLSGLILKLEANGNILRIAQPNCNRAVKPSMAA
jgi:hypothetical protein